MAPQRGSATRDPVRLAIIGLTGVVVLILVIGFGVVRDAGFFGMADPVRSVVFPELDDELERVDRVELRSGSRRVVLIRDGDGWVVQQKDGYPAEPERVRGMLSALTSMPALQRQQAGADQFSGLGVAGDNDESTRVSLKRGDGETLRTIFIGLERAAPGAEDLEAYYVRAADSDTVWLADADLAFPADPMAWLNKEAFAVSRARIRELKTAPDPGKAVHIRRATVEDATFSGVGLPEDIELEGQWVLGELVVPFNSMSFTDVRRAETPLEPGGEAQGFVTTFDGVKLWYSVEARDGGQWARFAAESVGGATEEEEDTGDAESAGQSPVSAETLNERLRRWEFRLPEFHAERMRRSVADLPRKGVGDQGGVNEGVTVEGVEGDGG